jgi:hypothetical protein
VRGQGGGLDVSTAGFRNEKSQETCERLYSEDRKRERARGIMKEVAGQQNSTKKPRQQKRSKQIQACP